MTSHVASDSFDAAAQIERTDPVSRLIAKRRFIDRGIGIMLFLSAMSSIAITVGIVAILIYESSSFFSQVSIKDFVTDTMWMPQMGHHGILPLVCGTFVTTFVALAVALPIGSTVAIYLSEFAPAVVREVLKPVLELLSAVPTIVYGYFALQFMTPLLQHLFPDLPTFNMLSAGIVMGIMIIPYVSSLSEDAMRAVPMLLREGSYALGANRLLTAIRVVFPSAFSGIAAAYILGISRALGETMIVAIAAGGKPTLTFNPMDSAETITAYIVRVSKGELPVGTVGYQSIFAAGIVLFFMTLGFNILGYYLRKRFRQAY
jgi:phosphate transport system permease protein